LHADYIGTAGSIIGCDLVGSVVAVGPLATRHKIGDKVFTAVHGGKYKENGSAAEYTLVDDSLAMSVPEGMSSEEAVTFGVGFLTAGAVSTLHEM
jgi:NADPH:quinone reductase-like Zn-dependent oxidoreductase